MALTRHVSGKTLRGDNQLTQAIPIKVTNGGGNTQTQKPLSAKSLVNHAKPLR